MADSFEEAMHQDTPDPTFFETYQRLRSLPVMVLLVDGECKGIVTSQAQVYLDNTKNTWPLTVDVLAYLTNAEPLSGVRLYRDRNSAISQPARPCAYPRTELAKPKETPEE